PQYGVATSPALPGAAEAVAAVRHHGGRGVGITGKDEPKARPHPAPLGLSVGRAGGRARAQGQGGGVRAAGVGIYLGDHPADMAAAVEAGAVPVGLTSGDHGAPELVVAGARTVLASLCDFPAWLETHRGGLDGGISVGLPGADR